MGNIGFFPETVFSIGPVHITSTVTTTWLVMAVIIIICFFFDEKAFSETFNLTRDSRGCF